MVKFELLIHINNKVNINENSIKIATVLTDAGFINLVTADSIIIFENDKAKITINNNICIFDIKVEIDWKCFNEYFVLIQDIIQYISTEKFKPILNLHLRKIVELNNYSLETSKNKTTFDYGKTPIFKNVIGVGFRFIEKTESNLLNDFKIEPWIKDPKCLYIEANCFFNTFDEMNKDDYYYTNFEEKINYFVNQYQ